MKMNWKIYVLMVLFFSSTSLAQVNQSEKVTITFLYSSTCPYCAQEKIFLNELEAKYPRLGVTRINIDENSELFIEYAKNYSTIPVGVPRTFIGDKQFIGFSREEGELKWYDSYKAYYGYSTVLENEIRELMDLAHLICECGAVEIAQEDEKVKALLDEYPDSAHTINLVNETFRIGWWSPARLKSQLDYPDVLVDVNAKTGEVLSSIEPDAPIAGVVKPMDLRDNRVVEVLLILFVAYFLAYVFLRKKVEQKYFISGLFLLLIASFFLVTESIPKGDIVSFAKSFSFPGFTFILALADGFNRALSLCWLFCC
ncbi:MAG: hypothetical protein B6U97_04660, partial [Candidatus Altiarchaeales archaeon ex4484_96]